MITVMASPALFAGRGNPVSALSGSPRSLPLARDDVEKGMEEMAKKFREEGGELYKKVS